MDLQTQKNKQKKILEILEGPDQTIDLESSILILSGLITALVVSAQEGEQIQDAEIVEITPEQTEDIQQMKTEPPAVDPVEYMQGEAIELEGVIGSKTKPEGYKPKGKKATVQAFENIERLDGDLF